MRDYADRAISVKTKQEIKVMYRYLIMLGKE
jgi:hypothetical protein